MSDLLPCPFCGKQPRLYAAQVIINGDCPESITCDNDDCLMMPSTDYLPIADAVDAWNRRALPTVQPDARIKEYEEAYQYALHLAEALRENYPPNPDFRFLGDLVGLLTQIDNMVAGLPQPAVQPDAALAGNMTAGGGAGQMSDTPVVTGLVTSNLTAGGGAEKMALWDAIRTGMGLLRVTYVDPDQMREDREERAMLAREDDQ